MYRCGGYVAEACLRIRSIRKRPLFKMWGKAKKKLSVILIAYQDFLMNNYGGKMTYTKVLFKDSSLGRLVFFYDYRAQFAQKRTAVT